MATKMTDPEQLEAQVNALQQELELTQQRHLDEIKRLNEQEQLLIHHLERAQAETERFFLQYKELEQKQVELERKNLSSAVEALRLQISQKNKKLHLLSQKLKLLRNDAAAEQEHRTALRSEIKSLKKTIELKDEQIRLLHARLSHVSSQLRNANRRSTAISGTATHGVTAKIRKFIFKIKNLFTKTNVTTSTNNDDKALLENSSYFDVDFYLANNPDVAAEGVDPIMHYIKYGGYEGRNPSAKFNSARYLERNPDVGPNSISVVSSAVVCATACIGTAVNLGVAEHAPRVNKV